VELIYCIEMSSVFGKVAEQVDAFVLSWQEWLFNSGSCTRNSLLRCTDVQLQCSGWISNCDSGFAKSLAPLVLQAHPSGVALRTAAVMMPMFVPALRNSVYRSVPCCLLVTSSSCSFINSRRIKLTGKHCAQNIRISQQNLPCTNFLMPLALRNKLCPE
jgi:hypothetical protein